MYKRCCLVLSAVLTIDVISSDKQFQVIFNSHERGEHRML